VPVIAPVVELMLSPSGKLVAEYVNGAIPPVIAGPLPLYGWFIVPAVLQGSQQYGKPNQDQFKRKVLYYLCYVESRCDAVV
jgi:hypothetical protein